MALPVLADITAILAATRIADALPRISVGGR